MLDIWDVFAPGGEYGWHSIGRVTSESDAAKLLGGPAKCAIISVSAYQEPTRGPLAGKLGETREKMVSKATGAHRNSVSHTDGWIGAVDLYGFFPADSV